LVAFFRDEAGNFAGEFTETLALRFDLSFGSGAAGFDLSCGFAEGIELFAFCFYLAA
jgi:hypothetical protein